MPKLILIVIKMKKKELIAVSLLCILVFVSFANVSVVASPNYMGIKRGYGSIWPVPSSYVGVKIGDEFVWTASLNMVNLNATTIALFGEENWTLMYDYFLEFYENGTGMEFDFLAGAGMKAVIQNVTDEMPCPYSFLTGVNGSGLYFDFYVAYAANNWTLVSEATNYTESMIFLADPSTLDESTIVYAVAMMELFMPIGINYSMFVDAHQTMIESNPYTNGNVTVQVQGNGFKYVLKATYLEWLFNRTGASFEIGVQGNGFKYVLKATYLEWLFNRTGASFEIGTLLDVEMTFRWNSIGVLDYASMTYGGLTLATAQLVPTDDGLIPGYELVTILGVSLATFIALIYTIQKKKILK